MGLSTACVTCHISDFNNTNSPSHAAAGFSQDCRQCHAAASWQGTTFNHAIAKFPLAGAHVTATCAQCHKNNVYAGLSTACITCHQTDFNGTNDPPHVAAGFSQDCTICHSTANWQGASFNHSTSTKFPLTGTHVTATCAQCHKNNLFTGLSAACITCHQTDFNGTKDPNHAAAGFPQDCSVCHSTVNWQGASFNHSTSTKFPLTGTHVTASCAQCHKNNVYAGLSAACITCPQTEFNGTHDPNHAAA
jgi:nitrate/TMAO reductase-like tetraheme cytochrome c subunit